MSQMNDLISRQAAVGVVDFECGEWRGPAKTIIKKLEALPAVQPDHTADIGKKVSISCGQENDLISRHAAIDALARMMPRSYTPDGSHPGDEEIFRVQEVFADCIEALEILPSTQPEQRWVPCSERLPKKNCRCLTTNEAWGSFEVDRNAWIDGQWLYPNEKPIAWMPMPEPYRGGEQDDR